MSEAQYDVLTWDPVAEMYTEQDGLSVPSLGVSVHGLRRALRELRNHFGYSCHRVRCPNGSHESDQAVLVERIDDQVIDSLVFPEGNGCPD